MWSPTHIQVTVQRAKNLLIKGKNGTNNCFVTIALAKEKYQTSIKEKATGDIDWHEECELTIPERGNRAELVLTCLHRNHFQMDEFLGQITIPLNEMDAYERPKSKWFTLQSKPGHEKKEKERGQLEVRVAFTVKAGSLTDLSKKDKSKSTLGLGGSLLSINTLEKRKSLKKFAKSLGSKVHISGKPKKDKDKLDESESISGSVSSIGTPGSGAFQPRRFGQPSSERNKDPGFISEDEDEFVFDNLSHKSSGSSLNVRSYGQPPPLPKHQPPSPISINKNQYIGGGTQVSSSPPPSIVMTPPSQSTTPPEPMTNQTTTTTVTPATMTINNEEVRLRSKTLPPSKPPRIANANETQTQDEWETKLYGGGKNLDLYSSSDALKRRSWEGSRLAVPLNAQSGIDEDIDEEPSIQSSMTAPTTPSFEHKRMHENDIKPKPLPRSSTLECIIEKDKEKSEGGRAVSPLPIALDGQKREEKPDKKPEKRLSKFKYFRKEKNASTEDLRRSSPKQFGERIIIGGHENEIRPIGKPIEISQNILKKYEGKTREEIMLIANDYENEVKLQRMKMKEMEDYLDNLLLRVMETQPKILQNPYRQLPSTKRITRRLSDK